MLRLEAVTALLALLAMAPYALAQSCDSGSAPRLAVREVSGGASCRSDPVVGCLADVLIQMTDTCQYTLNPNELTLSASSILLPKAWLSPEFDTATGGAPWTKGSAFMETCTDRIARMDVGMFGPAGGGDAGLTEVFNFVHSLGKTTSYSVAPGTNGFVVSRGSCSWTYVLLQDALGTMQPTSTMEAAPCPAGSFKASADTARVCVLCPPGSWSEGNATSCKPSGAGKFIASVGSTSDGVLCPPGTYGSPTYKPFLGPEDKVYFGGCLPCAVDTYAPMPGMSQCFTCKQGGAPAGGSPRCIAGYGGLVLTVEGADTANTSLIYDPNDQIWNLLPAGFVLAPGYGIFTDGTGRPAPNPAVVAFGDPIPGYSTAVMPPTAPICASLNPWLDQCVYTTLGASKSLAAYVDANGEATISVLNGVACGTLDADGTANSITNQTALFVDPNTLLIPGDTFVALVVGAGSIATYTVFERSTDASVSLSGSCSVGTVTAITNSFGGAATPAHANCPGGTTYDEKMDANGDGARYCRVCRLGTYCAKTAGVSPIEKDCNSGTYASLFGQDSMAQCISCPNGTFTDEPGQAGSNTCKDCAIGLSNGNDYCSMTCPDGQEPVDSQCQPCAAGSFRNGDMLTCIPCGPGSETAAFTGIVSADPGAATCQPCDAGYANGNHSANAEPYSICQACGNGTYAPRGGMESCALCPLGTFAPATGPVRQCTSCFKGFYTRSRGSTNCTACPRGTFSNAMGAKSSAYCLRCTPGSFSNVTAATSCRPCPRGFYAPAFASLQCLPCPPGFFQDLVGMGFCKPAPKGYYSLGASVAPVQCDIGTFQDQKGQSGCKPCSTGGYCISRGLTAPALCPRGTYNPLRGSTSITTCKACPTGRTTAREGSTASSQCTLAASG